MIRDLQDLRLVVAGESLAPPLTGIGQYARALVSSLWKDCGLSGMRIYDGRRLLDPAAALEMADARGRRAARLRSRLRALPGLYELRQRLRDARFSACTRGSVLYHEPNFVLKPFSGPRVTTVHDLSHMVCPEFHPAERVRFLERRLPASLAEASHILTVSRFTRDELVRLLGISHERITVTPLAAAARFRPLDENEAASTLARHGLRWKGFVLSAATFEPRKNLGGLIAAFSRLPAALRRAYPLALAGAEGWRSGALASALEKLLARGEAVRLGYVPDADLPALMSGCRCFAYPSFYEGFGLPLLEAQACGATAVAANVSALPEIAAETSLLVNPKDIEALTTALLRALEDEALAGAARVAGPAWAARFSWVHTASATLDAYRAVLSS